MSIGLFIEDARGLVNQNIFREVQLHRKRTDKKENEIFLIYKEIQNGAVAKLYMTNGLLINGEIFANMRKPFLKYDLATAPL
jgi:hypothetical protein